MDNLAWFIAPFLGFGRTSVENLFALLLFPIGSIHTYFRASGKLGAVHLRSLGRYRRQLEFGPLWFLKTFHLQMQR